MHQVPGFAGKGSAVAEMSPRERLLAAIEFRHTDYVPCCFTAWSALAEECTSQAEYLDRQLEMGLDAVVRVPEMPVRYHPSVRTREWCESPTPGEPYPILCKEYETAGGTLKTSVRKTEDWPHGDHVPLWGDYLIPRSQKFLVTSEDNLDPLRYILSSPNEGDVAAFREAALRAKGLATERRLATVAPYITMGDMASWLAGIQEVMMMTVDCPGFLGELLAIIEEWNRPYVDLAREAKLDLVVRRGWYENADFWSPRMYREFLLPSLKRQVETVHQGGAKFGYLVSCSSLPLVEMMMEAGVDVLLGVDPAQDRSMDLDLLKKRTGGRMALWGGVCGYLTIECGSTRDVESEVNSAIDSLAPGGGFILSPVSNIRATTNQAWRNSRALVDAWHRRRSHPGGQ